MNNTSSHHLNSVQTEEEIKNIKTIGNANHSGGHYLRLIGY